MWRHRQAWLEQIAPLWEPLLQALVGQEAPLWRSLPLCEAKWLRNQHLTKRSKIEESSSRIHEDIPPIFSSSSGAGEDVSGASRALFCAGSELEPSSRARFAADSLGVALKEKEVASKGMRDQRQQKEAS